MSPTLGSAGAMPEEPLPPRAGVARGEVIADGVAALLLCAVAAALLTVDPGARTLSLLDAALWSGAIAVVSVVRFDLGLVATSPVQLVLVPMWLAVPPGWLPLLLGAGYVLGAVIERTLLHRELPWSRVLLTFSDGWSMVLPAVVLAFTLPEPELSAAPILLGVLAAQIVGEVASATLRTWNGSRFTLPAAPRTIAWSAAVDAALAPVGLLVAIVAESDPLGLLAIVPLVGLMEVFARERDRRIRHAAELALAYRGTAQLMGDVLEADDAYTGGEHTHGVVELAVAVGKRLGLRGTQMRDLEFGALLHDIGKLRVPKEIINKPGKLNEEEWAIIRRHPGWGQEMLDRVGGPIQQAGTIVRAHHERWDGGGYPDGLAGDDIPLAARIITVCDSYSAMTTRRSYRQPMNPHAALEELRRCSGSQFDPQIVDAIEQVLVNDQLQSLAQPRWPHR